MRGLTIALVTLLAVGAGCKRQPVATEEASKSTAPALLSVVEMGDAQAASQLRHGFHELESGWRWAASKFGVTLAPPPGSGNAQLELKFTIPGAVIDRMGPVTLSATADGTALQAETYSKAGDYTYVRDVTVGSAPVAVEFSTDKALPPTGADVRELAVIVTRVGLVR